MTNVLIDKEEKVKTQTNYVQHFSTRIPWKDNDYTGRIDNNPRFNVAAQVIPNIASSRDLEFEEINKGKSYDQVGPVRMQSWITENAAFMSDIKLNLKMNHPYKKGNANAKFKHFEENRIYATPLQNDIEQMEYIQDYVIPRLQTGINSTSAVSLLIYVFLQKIYCLVALFHEW